MPSMSPAASKAALARRIRTSCAALSTRFVAGGSILGILVPKLRLGTHVRETPFRRTHIDTLHKRVRGFATPFEAELRTMMKSRLWTTFDAAVRFGGFDSIPYEASDCVNL